MFLSTATATNVYNLVGKVIGTKKKILAYQSNYIWTELLCTIIVICIGIVCTVPKILLFYLSSN